MVPIVATVLASGKAANSELVSIIPNGGARGDVLLSVALRADSSGDWRAPLLRAYPRAHRVTLWSGAGEALLWAKRDGSGSSKQALARAAKATATDRARYAIVDDFPFYWPLDEPGTNRTVPLAGGRSTVLRTVSRAPRVLVAEELLDASECAAIRRIAEQRLEPSYVYSGGQEIEYAGRREDFLECVDRRAGREARPGLR